MKKFFALCFFALPLIAGAQDLGIQVGKRAPAAIVRDLSGRPVNLGTYVGKTPMLIEFWATWCGNCQHLEPALLAAQKKYGAQVRFVGVAVSVNQSPERVRLYAAKHKLKHEILFDDQGNATDAYDVPATSYIVVVNKQGKIVYTGLGGDQNIEAALKKAL
ncbi:MAG: TlpA family protein disulfide reductase [Gemmatimonadaceae bacterium]|nr:TlpA family protein disulfide reductase [Gemmatimonadaceae bacterium]